jgi:hypothetical protein
MKGHWIIGRADRPHGCMIPSILDTVSRTAIIIVSVAVSMRTKI